MSNKVVVLITGCGGAHYLDTLPCYYDPDQYELIGVAAKRSQAIARTVYLNGYLEVLPATDPAYPDQLLRICHYHGVNVLIPTIEAEMEILAARQDDFRSIGTTIMVSNGDLRTATDKYELYKFAVCNNIPVPVAFYVKSIDGFDSVLRMLGYPGKSVCMKMTDKGGSRGFRVIGKFGTDYYSDYINNKPSGRVIPYAFARTILKGAARFPGIMLQQYVDGQEYSVDLVANANSDVVAIGGRSNNTVVNSIPQESVVSKNDAAFKTAIRLVKLLGLTGNIGFDFIIDQHGTPLLLEINPRITATVSLFAAAGLNLCKIGLEEHLHPGTYSADTPAEPVRNITMYKETRAVFLQRGIIHEQR